MSGTIAVLSAEEEKEFEDAVVKGFCPECGKAVYQNPRGRRKKFCSDACRFADELWRRITGISKI